jgi:beta-glucanase (GH16 family)
MERFTINRKIPSEKMYLYLNTAIGGNWPGSPDDTTVFPISFEIDYVRVYKGNGE